MASMSFTRALVSRLAPMLALAALGLSWHAFALDIHTIALSDTAMAMCDAPRGVPLGIEKSAPERASGEDQALAMQDHSGTVANVAASMVDACSRSRGVRVGAPLKATTPMPEEGSAIRGASGTGWLSEAGYLVTSLHVVEDRARVIVVSSQGRRYAATVVDTDRASDIAILAMDASVPRLRTLPLADLPPVLGAPISIIGYPMPRVLGISPKFQAGAVSGLGGARDDPRFLQIAATAFRGHSGSPVIDRSGRVIGMITSRVSAIGDERVANLALAIKTEPIAQLLSRVDAGAASPVASRALGTQSAGVPEMAHAVFLVYSLADDAAMDSSANAQVPSSP